MPTCRVTQDELAHDRKTGDSDFHAEFVEAMRQEIVTKLMTGQLVVTKCGKQFNRMDLIERIGEHVDYERVAGYLMSADNDSDRSWAAHAYRAMSAKCALKLADDILEIEGII